MMNKRKLRFNAVDAILLVILAVVIFAVLYIFVFSESSNQTVQNNYKTIRYTVYVQNLDERYEDMIKTGQKVTDGVEKKNIGTIIGVQSTPTVQTTFDYVNLRQVESTVEGKINVKVTIEAQAIETETAFIVDGLDIRVGQQYSIMLPDFYCVGYCIDLNDNQQN